MCRRDRSGITAIKNVSEAGISVVAYDFNSDVGGNLSLITI